MWKKKSAVCAEEGVNKVGQWGEINNPGDDSNSYDNDLADLNGDTDLEDDANNTTDHKASNVYVSDGTDDIAPTGLVWRLHQRVLRY